jgi:hypothetical protein
VKTHVKIRIETRDEGRCCSFRCPHLSSNEVQFGQRACQLFNALVVYAVGGLSPVRHRKCVQLEIVEAAKPKRPKAASPDVWDRLQGKPLV